MNVFAYGILVVGVLWLNSKGMGTEIISLSLKKIGREVFRSITIVEAEGGAESGRGNTPKSPFTDNISPARLCLVDGFGEEFIE